MLTRPLNLAADRENERHCAEDLFAFSVAGLLQTRAMDKQSLSTAPLLKCCCYLVWGHLTLALALEPALTLTSTKQGATHWWKKQHTLRHGRSSSRWVGAMSDLRNPSRSNGAASSQFNNPLCCVLVRVFVWVYINLALPSSAAAFSLVIPPLVFQFVQQPLLVQL